MTDAGVQARPLVVLTNRPWLEGRIVEGRTIRTVRATTDGLGAALRLFAIWRYDAVVIDCDLGPAFVACAAKRLLPWSRCRILAIDPVLTRPNGGVAGRLKFLVRRWLLGAIDRWILYFRDSTSLRCVYRLEESRVRYVPFKPNTLDQLRRLEPSDEGFFLSCGRSNRDFATLFEAFGGLPYECRVLAPWGEAEQHGTRVDGAERPPNVLLESDDGTSESWNRWISRARAVILPIEPGMLSPSGIGTYLVAMALGKCVVMTEGPATRGLIDTGEAVLVPPKDAGALRTAIDRVATDAAYRDEVARRGREYALGLGGEDRLRADVLAQLADLLLDGSQVELTSRGRVVWPAPLRPAAFAWHRRAFPARLRRRLERRPSGWP